MTSRQEGAYKQWERIKKEYDEGERKGVVIIKALIGDKIQDIVWPKSAYLRHVDKCVRRDMPIPRVLVEAPTVKEAMIKYEELIK